ncbi:NAD(P)H-hydrate epimerase [Oceanicoccus sp. KOV_DT_Chl]|uniref:NAD(P)H-hydrate epimerase n=1 Tax=Oceanicoccus sp. KOV_DT_Chl TaxID=1904639 RepID=UPI00350EED57
MKTILTDCDIKVMNSHQPLPTNLYRAAAVRELDRLAIEQGGIAGFTLMRRAGKAAFNVLQEAWPELERITVFCGTGNNGGDGYVMASLARQQGIAVQVVQCGDAEKIQGDALQARKLALQDGVEVIAFSESVIIQQGVIVDALLGTGLSGELRADALTAIAAMNASDCPVLAVDIPSGLCSDTGRVMSSAGNNSAVYAEHTTSFIGFKQGLLTGPHRRTQALSIFLICGFPQ